MENNPQEDTECKTEQDSRSEEEESETDSEGETTQVSRIKTERPIREINNKSQEDTEYKTEQDSGSEGVDSEGEMTQASRTKPERPINGNDDSPQEDTEYKTEKVPGNKEGNVAQDIYTETPQGKRNTVMEIEARSPAEAASCPKLERGKPPHELKRKGIRNLGNTCYINAVIQNLIRMPRMMAILHTAVCERQESGRGCEHITCYLKMIWDSFKEWESPVKIRPFINFLRRSNGKFIDGQPQDAQELLKKILEALGKELGEEDTLGMNGALRRTLTCKVCQEVRHTTEPFSEISVAIRSPHILNDIENFFSEERIDDLKCEACHNADVWARYQLIKPPELLCIQMKCFDHQGKKIGENRELIKELYLECDGLGTSHFQLKTTIDHLGDDITTGHYIARELDGEKVFTYNDEKVHENEPRTELFGNPYLLFFSRVQDPVKIKNTAARLNETPVPGTTRIAARSMQLLPVEVKEPGEFVCRARQLDNGLLIGNSLLQATGEKGLITVANVTEKDIHLREIELELESLNNYKVSRDETLEFSDPEIRIGKLLDEVNLSHLHQEEKEPLISILREYHDVFQLEGEVLTCCEIIQHEIPTQPNIAPINVRPYRLPFTQREEIQRQTAKLLADGLIQKSKSAWNAPLLLVPKKADETGERKWRLVVDFRKLNDVTLPASFPLPNITEILDQLGKATRFTTLDLTSGYHQIKLSPESREKTAFSTGSEHFEWIRMPMGLKYAGFTFQRAMNNVLSGLTGIEGLIYLDDIVIPAETIEIHTKKLRRILHRLREHNVKLQPNKCKFLMKEVVYLGHLITEEGVKPDPSKIQPIQNFPTPKNPKDIKSFLGMIGYYRRSIPRFAEISKPLTRLLKKNATYVWDTESEQAFQELKERLISPPVLQYPDFTKKFYLTTDASLKAISAVLSQKDEKDLDHPISYASRTLLDAETRYTTTEQELLAIVWAVEYYKAYLFGNKFCIRSDHKPLMWLMRVKDASSRLMRWKLKLAGYDFEIQHVTGKSNYVADCLSRYPEEIPIVDVKAITRAAAKRLNERENEEIDQNNTLQHFSKDIPTIVETSDNNIAATYRIKLRFSRGSGSDPSSQNISHSPGEVTKTQTDEGIEFTLAVEGESTTNKDTLIKGLQTLKHLLLKEHITEILISKTEMMTNFGNPEEIITTIRGIFQETNIHFLIFYDEVRTLTRAEDIDLALQEYHVTPCGGHQGAQRMFSRITNKFKWKGMKKQIKRFVAECGSCQRNKIGRKHKMPMQITTTAKNTFERLALDIVGPLPTTREGFKFLLTWQDDLSKFVGAIPVENQEADTIARAFALEIILKYGMPDGITILTDQGSNFQSELFKRVCKLLRINKRSTSAWHPESNGSLERSHRTLKEYLRHYVNANLDDWNDFINFGVFTMNSTRNESTGYSPFELVYGHKAVVPSTLTCKPQPVYNYENYYYELRYKLQKAHEIARENQLVNKNRSKGQYDKNTRPLELTVGDFVWKLNTGKRGEGVKLQPLYKGPYLVTDIVSDVNVRIKVGRNEKIVHKNLLKKHYCEGHDKDAAHN